MRRGKECEVPTHLIENSTFFHTARVTKIGITAWCVAKKLK